MALPPAPRRALLVGAALALAAAAPSRAQEPVPPPDTALVIEPVRPDSTVEEEGGFSIRDLVRRAYGRAVGSSGPRASENAGIRVRPLFPSLSHLYSGSRGFGIGGGVEVRGLGAADAEWEVEGRLQQHFMSARTAFYTGDPYLRAIYGMLAGTATTTDRLSFYGTGPRTVPEAKVYLDQVSAEVEARAGWYPYRSTGLLVQPTARFRFDRLRGFMEGREGAFDVIDPEDTLALSMVRDENRYGVMLGVEAAGDTRDRRAAPRRGGLVQAAAARFFALDGSGLGFNRYEASGYYFHPALVRLPFLPERGTLFVRASFVVTREDDGDHLPYYYLPVLDHDLLAGFPQRRFVGRDGFSVGIGARGAVLALFGTVLLEGVGLVMVGGAYDNIFEDFSPRVTFDPDPVGPDERVPLRPSLAIGANIVTIDRDNPIIGGMIGLGPEGVVLSSLRIVFDIRDYRPQIR